MKIIGLIWIAVILGLCLSACAPTESAIHQGMAWSDRLNDQIMDTVVPVKP